MTAALTVFRRALTGFLGFVAAEPAEPVIGPDAALETALATLQRAERDFCALPDHHPQCEGLIAAMDALLASVAMIRPASDRGYSVKARIARVYGDCAAGERVRTWLLSDLMIRGRAVA